jgi:Ca2+-binding RTX toxin-like protein
MADFPAGFDQSALLARLGIPTGTGNHNITIGSTGNDTLSGSSNDDLIDGGGDNDYGWKMAA